MAHEEGLLALDLDGGKAGLGHHGRETIPSNMAGEVLLARMGEKVVI
jgi:hypothetical protein